MMEIVIPYDILGLFINFVSLFILWVVFAFLLAAIQSRFDVFGLYTFGISLLQSGFLIAMVCVLVSLFQPTPLGIQLFNFSIGGAP
jgi:hypothetical protein